MLECAEEKDLVIQAIQIGACSLDFKTSKGGPMLSQSGRRRRRSGMVGQRRSGREPARTPGPTRKVRVRGTEQGR